MSVKILKLVSISKHHQGVWSGWNGSAIYFVWIDRELNDIRRYSYKGGRIDLYLYAEETWARKLHIF